MSRKITPLHIMSAFQTEPPALDFVIPGFLSGTVGALYSPGGVGKSFLALEIAASVAGVDLLGLGCQSASKFEQVSASNFEQFQRGRERRCL